MNLKYLNKYLNHLWLILLFAIIKRTLTGGWWIWRGNDWHHSKVVHGIISDIKIKRRKKCLNISLFQSIYTKKEKKSHDDMRYMNLKCDNEMSLKINI